MKIKDIRCEVYPGEEPQPPRKGYTPFTVMRIITDNGIEGFGDFAFSDEITVEDIKPLLIGRDPFDREWIWQTIWRMYGTGRGRGGQCPIGVLSAVDVALWDIAGKALGQPIYKLLGAYRDKVRIYASSYGLPTPQDYAKEVAACKKQGITAYKIHVRPEITIEVCRAARKAGGADMTLMLDGGTGGSRERALRVGRELEKLNYYWFEEPVPDTDIEGLIMLREKLDIPICATESAPRSMFSIPEYLVRRACDIVHCCIRQFGGITPAKKIADMCNAFGMQCEFHHAGRLGACFILDIAYLHTLCAIKNCEFYEMRWPVREYGLKEYPVLDNEGYIHAPQKPGLGVEIDWKVLGKPVATY